jgi:membrane protein YdbS with pleckstrin-like domain
LSVALAAFPPAVVVYREEQNFDWRVYALVAAAEVLVWFSLVWFYQVGPEAPGVGDLGTVELAVGLVVGLVLPALVLVGLLRMTTEVAPTDLRVWFGWIPTYRRIVPIGNIQRIEVVTYRPIADYGGWGIRQGRDGVRVLNARGNRGVRIDLADGTRLLIGSQRPEELARALEQALRPIS